MSTNSAGSQLFNLPETDLPTSTANNLNDMVQLCSQIVAQNNVAMYGALREYFSHRVARYTAISQLFEAVQDSNPIVTQATTTPTASRPSISENDIQNTALLQMLHKQMKEITEVSVLNNNLSANIFFVNYLHGLCLCLIDICVAASW